MKHRSRQYNLTIFPSELDGSSVGKQHQPSWQGSSNSLNSRIQDKALAPSSKWEIKMSGGRHRSLERQGPCVMQALLLRVIVNTTPSHMAGIAPCISICMHASRFPLRPVRLTARGGQNFVAMLGSEGGYKQVDNRQVHHYHTHPSGGITDVCPRRNSISLIYYAYIGMPSLLRCRP